MYPENWKKFGLVGRLRLLSGTLIPGISVSKLGDIQIYISPKSISQISASLDLFLSLKRITDNIATRSMVGANMAIQKKGSRTMNVGRLGVHTKKQPKNKRWPDETHFTSQRGKNDMFKRFQETMRNFLSKEEIFRDQKTEVPGPDTQRHQELCHPLDRFDGTGQKF